MVVNRVWAMPHKNTFSIKPIGELVERYTSGEKVIIDPFANNCKIGTITNDLNPKFDTTYHAPFNCVDFCERVMMDSILAKCISTNPVKTSIFVSHLNYTDGEIFGDCTIDDLAKKFDITYRSSSKYAEDVIK